MLPHDSDVDDFLDEVNTASRLINGLRDGTIPPEYVDTKIAARSAKTKQQDAAARPQQQTADQRGGAPAARADDADADTAAASAKQAELMRKVEELKQNRQRKLKARSAYERYVAGKGTQQQHSYATDYAQWDLFCPSDDEDDLFNSLTPSSSPAFAAMERDISSRHARMVEQRQIAERQRQAGNAAFKAGQHSEALRCYEQGLEAQRHNMALHANAAMAALKLQCWVTAQEHCDKVLHLAEVLHNTPKHPLCVKALQRRAAAHQGLCQHSKAVADLQAAADILPGDAEVLQQLKRAQALHEEHRLARRLTRLVEPPKEQEQVQQEQQEQQEPSDTSPAGCSSAGPTTLPATSTATSVSTITTSSGSSSESEVTRLQRIKQLVGDLSAAQPGSSSSSGQGHHAAASSAATTCQQLLGLVQGQRCSLFFRECGGLDAAARLVVSHRSVTAAVDASSSSDAAAALQQQQQASAALQVLSAACCDSDTALEALSERVLGAALDLVGSKHTALCAAALELAYAASISSTVRAKLCGQLLSKVVQMTVEDSEAPSGTRLEVLWRLCCCRAQAGNSTSAQVHLSATSLLSNCMLVPAVRAATLALLQQQQRRRQPQTGPQETSPPQPAEGTEWGLESLAQALKVPQGPAAASQGTLESVTQSAASAKAVCGLLSNMCNHTGLRAQLADCQPLVQRVLRLCGGGQEDAVLLAAMGCLCNLSVDEGVQQLLAADAQLLDRLLQLTAAGPATFAAARSDATGSNTKNGGVTRKAGAAAAGLPKLPARANKSSSTTTASAAAATTQPAAAPPDAAFTDAAAGCCCLAARAATLLSRAAKQAEGVTLLQPRGAFGALAAAVTGLLDAAGDGVLAEGEEEWLGAAVRTLALLAAAAEVCRADCGAAGAAIPACCRLLRRSGNGDSTEAALRGNAALVLKAFADDKTWQAALTEADAVGALVAAARSGGKGSASSRNAGIALALLCKQSSVFLERLRELRGLEVLYEFVRP